MKLSYSAKIGELLCGIISSEVKLSSYASNEFINLLESENGGEFLRQYVRSSSNCSELLEAWNIHQGKPGMSSIVSLVASILNHSTGKYDASDHSGRIGISRVLDKLASSIIKEKMEHVYKEFNSQVAKRQKEALLLMDSVVRRGSGLARDVATSFDFKLPAFKTLARKRTTRKALVWFAMSFLETETPWLLREVIQQKDLYSGVLCGLGDDDDETVDYVLSTLRDRILVPESLLRPALRSVLFGSVTLEQLANISGEENRGQVAELAHQVLLMVCTDPSNGLMPDLKIPLKGNLKRLLDFMTKLRATRVHYHKDLLLAIVKGRPTFGWAYLDKFSLEDHGSPNWFDDVRMAANLVSAVGTGIYSGTLSYMDNLEVDSFIKCICPRPFSRTVINKGLLHTDSFVKHATLRLLLESLKLLDSLIGIINTSISCSEDQKMQSLAYVKQEIQNQVQTLLPDPQVLLTLISSLNSHFKAHQASPKRKQTSDSKNISKRPKTNVNNEDSDITGSGICSDLDITMDGNLDIVIGTVNEDEPDHQNSRNTIMNIWDLPDSSTSDMSPKDVDIHFHAKLLDALKIYIRTMPNMLEESFDFFMGLLSSPLALTPNLLRSLLSVLIEYVDRSHRCSISIPPLIKYLHHFINLLLISPIRDIRDQANGLAHAAMLSTGAFDKNVLEIGAWLIFLPGLGGDESSLDIYGNEVLQNPFPGVVSFLCDAISTVGKNLFKYWDLVRYHIYKTKCIKDMSPDFSPLIICVLQKCLSVLNSDKGSRTLPEKTIISSYTSNTISYILQSQVDAVLLSLLIESVLLEGINDHSFIVNESGDELSEWRPMRKLWLFSQRITRPRPSSFIYSNTKSMHGDNSFETTLGEVQRALKSRHIDGLAGIIKAFSSAIICTTPDEILRNFPLVISISHSLHGVPFSFLSSTLLLEQSLLADISKLWSDLFFRGLELALSMNDCNNNDSCPSEAASIAFSYFLKFCPFHVIFPLMMRIDSQYLKEPLKISDLLLPKLCGRTTDYLISSLHLVLFWAHRIQLSYIIKSSIELEQLFEICFILVERTLSNLLVMKPDYDRSANMVETIFSHPLVGLYLVRPLDCNQDLENDFEIDLQSSKQRVHKLDHQISSLLKTTSDYVLTLCKGENSTSQVSDNVKKRIGKGFRAFVQRLFGELRNRFDLCIVSKNIIPLVPTVHTLYALIHSISPFELLELVDIIFSRVNLNDMTTVDSCTLSALSVVFCIAGATFEVLSDYMKHSNAKRVPCNFFGGMEYGSCPSHIFGKLYYKLFNVAKRFDLEPANLCLVKAVNVVLSQKYMSDQNFLPLSFVMLRVIESNPIDIVSHLIKKISISKAKLLFAFTELSPLHLSAFGHLFSKILSRDVLKEGNLMDKTSSCAYSDEELIMLLPTALSYLNSAFVKFRKQHHTKFSSIPSVYSRVLLKGFLKWKSYASQNIFDVERDEFLPSSFDKTHSYVQDTLLGKAIRIFQCHMDLRGGSINMVKRVKLFDSVCPHSTANSGLLDCDVSEMDSYSLSQTLNLINRIVAKISLCKILLFSEGNGDLKENNLGLESNKVDSSRLFFIDVLVSSWQLIVKIFPSSPANSGKENGTDCACLFKFLEDFILKIIVELARKKKLILVRLHSIPFIEKLSRSALLYRFEDPTTLKMLRNVLNSLSDGNFSHVLIRQLVVSHSQFAPTIHSISKTSGSQLGAFSKPVSSILRSLNIPSTDGRGNCESAGMYEKQLEIIKLLRVLFTVKADQGQFEKENEKSITINYRELLLLLLSSYGATVSEIDLEIYNLMHDIEALEVLDSGNIAEMDYLWGSAALKLRIEQAEVVNLSSESGVMTETEDHRRSQFRENLPVDPKLCLATVLYFPYHRTFIYDTLDNNPEAHSFDIKNIQRYDPVFMLRFSIHSLSVGYIEPVEFAVIGLLAVAFVSISSPDKRIRQLGYEALCGFKSVLERCQKRKDVMRFRLLLYFMQNGINEKWQKIPSAIAIFAAEASFVLLDPSNDQFSTICKILIGSSKVNFKCIPSFHNLLGSSSANFKTERLWILRLSCAGLNLEDDAQIYIKNSIIEDLLSFYLSPLSDIESRKLILQLLKKAIKLHKMARHLVEHCGLVSWLSSIIPFSTVELCADQRSSFSSLLDSVIEVVNGVISFQNIIEWMQENGLEQLMELSSHLYKLLVQERKFMKENITLLNSVLKILASTIEISQTRRMFQPHFTLPVEGFFEIQQTVNDCGNKGSGQCTVLGLKLILMSTPPAAINQMNGEKIFEFLSWATTTAMLSDATQMLRPKKSYCDVSWSSEEEPYEEGMVSKLLRWLTASVIIGKISGNSNEKSDVLTVSNLETMQTLMDRVKNVHGENGFISEDTIATTIVYLQQLLGNDYSILPSVVSALSLLLHPEASYLTGSDSNIMLSGGNPALSLLSRIRSPAEANPSWRWSYRQQWEDHTIEPTDPEKLDEVHACQTLLVIISNELGKSESPYFKALSYQDVENSGVFKWENDIIQTE